MGVHIPHDGTIKNELAEEVGEKGKLKGVQTEPYISIICSKFPKNYSALNYSWPGAVNQFDQFLSLSGVAISKAEGPNVLAQK